MFCTLHSSHPYVHKMSLTHSEVWALQLTRIYICIERDLSIHQYLPLIQSILETNGILWRAFRSTGRRRLICTSVYKCTAKAPGLVNKIFIHPLLLPHIIDVYIYQFRKNIFFWNKNSETLCILCNQQRGGHKPSSVYVYVWWMFERQTNHNITEAK